MLIVAGGQDQEKNSTPGAGQECVLDLSLELGKKHTHAEATLLGPRLTVPKTEIESEFQRVPFFLSLQHTNILSLRITLTHI